MKLPRPHGAIFLAASSLAALLLLGPAAHAQETAAADSETTPSSSLPSIGSTTASKSTWTGARVEINELKRSTTGHYTLLTWTLHNDSGATISLDKFRNTTYFYPSGTSGDGLVLIDETQGVRFNTYIDEEDDCLCAGVDHIPGQFRLQTKPGSHTTYWASYQLSEDTEKVTIEIPGFLPVKDVPVS